MEKAIFVNTWRFSLWHKCACLVCGWFDLFTKDFNSLLMDLLIFKHFFSCTDVCQWFFMSAFRSALMPFCNFCEQIGWPFVRLSSTGPFLEPECKLLVWERKMCWLKTSYSVTECPLLMFVLLFSFFWCFIQLVWAKECHREQFYFVRKPGVMLSDKVYEAYNQKRRGALRERRWALYVQEETTNEGSPRLV